MKSYSKNTRVELTVKGWLYCAESAVRASEKVADPKESAKLTRRARNRIQIALVAVDAGSEKSAMSSNCESVDEV